MSTLSESLSPSDRIAAILALPEAKGRESAADHLATHTKMTVDEAAGLLATLPTASQVTTDAMWRGIADKLNASQGIIAKGLTAAVVEMAGQSAADALWAGIVAKLNAN